jgi:3-phosphoshikimate 1-carboxyvinyltransferase
VTVRPATTLRGALRVPGDKSISHRYALLAALADGVTRITGYATGADCAATLACLEALGVRVRRTQETIEIEGRGPGGLSRAPGPLDARNSGTTMRLLAGILAGHPFESTLTGDESLSRRPMRRVAEPLGRMGAQVLTGPDGRPPLRIRGAALRAIEYAPPVPSAQVKSAVLLAGLHADGTTTLVEAIPTRDHTERALAAFGLWVEARPGRVALRGHQRPVACDLQVPGDLSSAAFFGIAAAALPGADVAIEGVGLNETRTGWLDVLKRAGARVEITREGESGGEPYGTVRVRHGGAARVEIAPAEVPGVIDELPALAAMATAGGALTVTGAAELRAKESDRITALVAGLRGLGADADELPDGFVIRGARRLRGGSAEAAGDHRLAMAFAIAALGAEAPSTITGAEAVAVSYPDFFPVLERLRA